MKTFGEYVTDKTSQIKSQFLAEVEFGMPSKQCRNFGICRIMPLGEEDRLKDFDCSKAVAIVTVFDQSTIELDFLRCTVSSIDYEIFFSKGRFLVEEEYRYTAEGLENRHFNVQKGQYLISENNSLIKVLCHL